MRRLFFFLTTVLFLFPALADAGISKGVFERFKDLYRPAKWHTGLEFAHTDPDLSKLEGYVVIKSGGIPAQRAEYTISWDKYDYRGVTIDGDTIETRRGKIYTYLRPGTEMIVAGIEKLGNTLYFNLLSKDVYKPEGKLGEKRCSRVSLKLGIKFSSDLIDREDFDGMNRVVNRWIEPLGMAYQRPSEPIVEKKVKKEEMKKEVLPQIKQVEKEPEPDSDLAIEKTKKR